ncbi:MAG: hypothetical protein M0002_20630 [Rhodospirillales bacterium]|nr:hypothetical protein [Rhodospirillales bacterium]
MIDMGMNESGTEGGTLHGEFVRLREELAQIRDLLTKSGAEVLSGPKAAAESRLAALQAEVERLAAEVKGQGSQVLHEIDRKVQERPLTSLALAFGVGLLAAQLLRR